MRSAVRWVWWGVLGVLGADAIALVVVASRGGSIAELLGGALRGAPFLVCLVAASALAVAGAFLRRRQREPGPVISAPGAGGTQPVSIDAVRTELRGVAANLRRAAEGAEPDAVSFIDRMLAAAVHVGASDVHIQPLESGTKVTFRVQGLMEDVETYPPGLHPRLVQRLKILASLVTYQSDRPQDGHFSSQTVHGLADVRISVLPTMHGEKVVLRLLRGGVALPDLLTLGFPERLIETFHGLLARPQGLIALTGPTGSGKTTTIYAALGHIKKTRGETASIATIEDPVEYNVPDLTQTAVTAQLPFSAGLRSILRQDPNVIMVGEIRDTETAQIALQAGLTGHLILTTVHANSAAGVFNRLIEMGPEPYLLASVCAATLSQRLVRALCPSCKIQSSPTPQQAAFLDMHGEPHGAVWEGPGCEHCGGSGYSGRIAIFELLVVTPALQQVITDQVPTPQLHEAAKAEGMTPLANEGIARARAGATSLTEVMRVAS